MNERLTNVTESVNENVSERLTSHMSEVESNTRDMVVRELSSFKERVTEENLNFMQGRVDIVTRNNDAKLGEISSRLEKLQERLDTASCNRNTGQSAVREPMEQGDSSRSSVQRSSSTPVVNFETRQESERMMDEFDSGLSNHCSGSDHVPIVSVNIRNADGQAHRPRELAELTHPQCPNHGLNDIVLPKFFDCHRQNVVQFLQELDDYYRLKSVPESLKLPIAVKAISDPYSKQWFTAVYEDLTGYDNFKRAFTELLWSPQIQSQACSQLYQDRLEIFRASGRSITEVVRIGFGRCNSRAFSAICSEGTFVSRGANSSRRICLPKKAGDNGASRYRQGKVKPGLVPAGA
ncbi:hypothetical protein L798_09956 [Zootermopsis nevadensis]|uniref:Uncharacterized protein n=1 Tax=Zootermopsis nevadensis TaxID=136037 RepID=A0A067R0T4_ZOONE|nr:hypothetical protein L798_09956 [Zootermopsis nevadensis]